MKTGILFDLDGTLLDTLEDLRDAVNYALNLHGYPLRSIGEVRRFVGNGAENLIRRALPANEGTAEVQKVLGAFQTYYTSHCQVKTKPYSDIPESLALLGEKYPMAIVSNKPDGAVKALCAGYFPGVYALGEVPGCPRKPAADMVFMAMNAIGVEKCVYVGDSEVDVLTAQNAEVPCVSVLWGFRDREDMEAVGAKQFCETPEDLPACIDRAVLSLMR